MNIGAESYGHAVILNLKGELTADTLGIFQQAVEHQLASKDVIDIVLNMEQVAFVDSAAMEYLLDLQDKLSDRLGQVKFIRPDDNVRKILELTRLASSFETFRDAGEAVRVIQG